MRGKDATCMVGHRTLPAMRRRIRSQTRSHAFTLIEVVVALLLFGFGMLAMQGAALLVLRQAKDARAQTLATMLATSRLEQFGHAPCEAMESGTLEARGVRLEWIAGEILGGHARVVNQFVRFQQGRGERVDSSVAAIPCR